MILTEIELRNFRNYPQLKLGLSPHINIFFGQNAQGKTNILEAISFLCIARSFRTKKESEVIRWHQDYCFLRGRFERNFESSLVEIGIGIVEKKIKHNAQIIKIGEFPLTPVVIFSPDDLQIIKGGPQLRRDFLDFYLAQVEPHYRFIYYNFYKVLQQRNKMLKETVQDRQLLDTWDEQLIDKGSKVIKYRIDFIQKVRDAVIKAQFEISGHDEIIGLGYLGFQDQRMDVSDEIEIKELFRSKLEAVRHLERERGVTLVGPHRDDLLLTLGDNIEIRNFGSQGQQRTAALALKIGLIDKIKESRGVEPLILLDDVMSEFDDERKKSLLKLLMRSSQTFLTSTNRRDFPVSEGESMMFMVDKGIATRG